MFFSLFFLYSSALFLASLGGIPTTSAEEQWVKTNSLNSIHGVMEEMARKTAYPMEPLPVARPLSARVYSQHGAPLEYNVSGVLKFKPIHEMACNETIYRLFTSMCQISDGANANKVSSRRRRSFIEKEIVAAPEFMNNNELLKSFLVENIPSAGFVKRSALVNELEAKKLMELTIMQCCVSYEWVSGCTFEKAKQKAAGLCNPGAYLSGPRFNR